MKAGSARRLIPPALLRRVQKHVEGALVWIPVRQRHHHKTAGHPARNRAMRRLRARGASIRELSRRFGLSVARAWQIVRGMPRGRRWAGSPPPPGRTIDVVGSPKGAAGRQAPPPKEGPRPTIPENEVKANSRRNPGRSQR
jgi:hypothetical protein